VNTSLAISSATRLNQRRAISLLRKVSLTAGTLYILAFLSIPAFFLYRPIHGPNFITGPTNNNAVFVGGLLKIIVALAGVATAIILYPVLRRQNESLALGLVASRVLDAGTMFVGLAFLLSVTLQQTGAGNDALATSPALVSLYNRIFLLGQGFIPAISDLL
jgi:hypothetical protein